MRAALFIHGFLSGPDDWDRIHPYLAKDYDHIEVFKQPGHERLDSLVKPKMKDFTADAAYKKIDSLFDELEKEYSEIDVIGHSMGGAMAIYLAGTRKIRKLVLLAPAISYLRFDFFFAKNIEEDRLKEISTKNGYEQLYKNSQTDFQNSLDVFFKRILPYTNPITLLTLSKISEDGKHFVDKINVPFLILWGKLDEFIPESGINEIMEKSLSSTKYRIDYDNYGHAMLYLSGWKEIAEDIRAFLNDEDLFETKSSDYPMKTVTKITSKKNEETTIIKKYKIDIKQ